MIWVCSILNCPASWNIEKLFHLCCQLNLSLLQNKVLLVITSKKFPVIWYKFRASCRFTIMIIYVFFHHYNLSFRISSLQRDLSSKFIECCQLNIQVSLFSEFSENSLHSHHFFYFVTGEWTILMLSCTWRSTTSKKTMERSMNLERYDAMLHWPRLSSYHTCQIQICLQILCVATALSPLNGKFSVTRNLILKFKKETLDSNSVWTK